VELSSLNYVQCCTSERETEKSVRALQWPQYRSAIMCQQTKAIR
jgi:hypothetical protein